MYAVVESGGKQYKVEKGTALVVDRLDAKEGAKVELRPVMFRDKEVVAEPKELAKVKVEATVAEHLRDHALFIAFAPSDKPTIALAVLVENAGFGARAAAPVARQVLDFYLLGKDISRPVPKPVPKPPESAPAPVDDDDGED